MYMYLYMYTYIPLQEEVHMSAVAETCSSDPQVLHETKILDLVTHNLLIQSI